MWPHESLQVWQVTHRLALEIDTLVGRFPCDQRFGLAAQLRRAALSVPTNLAEGRSTYGTREYLRYVRIAIASIAEVAYLLRFARDAGYVKATVHEQLAGTAWHARGLMLCLARSLQRR